MNEFIQQLTQWSVLFFVIIFFRHPLKRLAEHLIHVADGE